MSQKISVTILTKNSQKYLKKVLSPLKSFEEVLILDNGSEDQTLDIAREFPNIAIKTSPFIGFGPLHNKAVDLSKNDWILSVDSDEILTPELIAEIQNTQLDEQSVYFISRKNLFKGKWIRGCGWSPDYQARLFNRKTTRFSDAPVHEQVIFKGLKTHYFKHPLIHYSYEKTEDFLTKMRAYATLFATGKKKKSGGLFRALLHSYFAFFKSYLLKGGIRDGKEGFLISKYQGDTAFYKYMMLDDYPDTPS